jgi:hypothetical protein
MRKFIVRIEVDKDVADAIPKAADRLGMTQLSMISRMVKWLGRQDVEIQTEILNESAPSAVASKLLKRWAAGADGRPKKKG